MATKDPSLTSEIPVAPTETPIDPPNRFRRFQAFLFRNKLTIGLSFFTTYALMASFAAVGDGAIKSLYLIKEIGLSADEARRMLHIIAGIAYFLPLFGAVVADTWIGRYKAISRFVVISVAGHLLFALSTFPPLGLSPPLVFYLISVAARIVAGMFAGPCVPGFIGDQFVEGQEELRRRFYSVKYLIFNGLALIAMFLYPTLRAKMGGCFGSQFCYPLAFGFSGVLYVISLIILFCGHPFYRVVPPSGTVTKNFVICVWIAIRERFKDRTKREHWLDRADVRFSPEFIESVKAIFSLVVLFLPMPVYFSLYEQMDTTWTVQSDLLDGRLSENFEILPDSMDAINTFLVIILIPFFDYVLYPLLGKFNILTKPLQRMCTGGFFAAFAFLLCGFLNMQIEKNYPFVPSPGKVDLMIINSVDCKIDVYFGSKVYNIPPYQFQKINEIQEAHDTFTVVPTSGCPMTSEEKFTLKLQSPKVYSVVLNVKSDANVTMNYAVQRRERNKKANTVMRFIYLGELPFSNAFLLVKSKFGEKGLNFSDGFSEYFEVIKFTKYDLCWSQNNTDGKNAEKTCYGGKITASINEMYKGAIIDTLILYDNTSQTASLKMMFAYPEDNIPILYQFPQYLLLTIGEVLLSVTSLTFNYSQAPVSLKAVVTAMWLFVHSLGHLIITIFVQIKMAAGLEKDSTTMFGFASLMILDMTAFCYVSYRFKYRTHNRLVES